jgi:hypothetical protein
MANAASKIRALLDAHASGIVTFTDIRNSLPDLQQSEISMALSHFMKQRYLTRELIENKVTRYGRRQIWQYTYFPRRLPAHEVMEPWH